MGSRLALLLQMCWSVLYCSATVHGVRQRIAGSIPYGFSMPLIGQLHAAHTVLSDNLSLTIGKFLCR